MQNIKGKFSFINAKHLSQIPFKTRLYMVIFITAVFGSLFTLTTHAYFGGQTPWDLYVTITNDVKDVNYNLQKAFEFGTGASPFAVINNAPNNGAAKTAVNAIKDGAWVVAILLLLVEFFKKVISFEWASKWETILMFIIKTVAVKQVIQYSDTIIGTIYKGFNSIVMTVTGGGNFDFLPVGNLTTDGGKGEWSKDAVNMFISESVRGTDYKMGGDSFWNMEPIMQGLYYQIFHLALLVIGILLYVVIIGRLFELIIYTMFAPLPLATFASSETSDVGKSFIKNYIAIILQLAVIAIMFIAFAAILNLLKDTGQTYYNNNPLLPLVALLSLVMGVMKSGSWSKKICGTG